MASTYQSIPIYLSGFNLVTGYRCPDNKTALVKQISVSNETSSTARIDVKWDDYNSVGVGTSMTNGVRSYPVAISGISTGFSTRKLLEDFLAIKAGDAITVRSPDTGRANIIFTIIEQDVD